MANKKKKRNITPILLTALVFFILGIVFLFVVNNFNGEPVYDFVSCTYNKHSCEAPAWDGICTDEIEDECCTEIRVCSGIVSNPTDCLDKYCYEDGKRCEGIYTTQGLYECKCIGIYT